MANELDEVTAVPREEGRDVNVIDKQLETRGHKSALVLEIILFILGSLVQLQVRPPLYGNRSVSFYDNRGKPWCCLKN